MTIILYVLTLIFSIYIFSLLGKECVRLQKQNEHFQEIILDQKALITKLTNDDYVNAIGRNKHV